MSGFAGTMRSRGRSAVRDHPGPAADVALLAVALTWGTSFALQKIVTRQMGPDVFNAARFAAALIVLGPLFWPHVRRAPRAIVAEGLGIGAVLGAAMVLQSMGLMQTTATAGGFISGLPVVITPIIAVPLLGERPGTSALIGVALATAGLGLISVTDDFRVGIGDAVVFVSSVLFGLQIVLTGRIAGRADPRAVGTLQVAGALAVSVAGTVAFDRLPASVTPDAAAITVYLGIVNLGFVWVVQSWAQRHRSATRTALVLTMEPVFAALFAWLWLGESLPPRAALGAAAVLGAMVVASAGPSLTTLRRARGTMEP